jgi:hypothetical protein
MVSGSLDVVLVIDFDHHMDVDDFLLYEQYWLVRFFTN